MSGELLPCPFCGGEGFIYNVVPNYAWWACRCASCGVETSSYHTEAEAIEAWNRRADDHFCDATKMVEQTAVPNNEVHLCEFCKYSYPECPAEKNDVIFGNGKGQDNICACAKFEIKPERTAKVIEHDVSVTDTDGYKYHRSEYLCGDCKKKVLGGDDYCSHCGARLEWE